MGIDSAGVVMVKVKPLLEHMYRSISCCWYCLLCTLKFLQWINFYVFRELLKEVYNVVKELIMHGFQQ